jgi:hypothetical protein
VAEIEFQKLGAKRRRQGEDRPGKARKRCTLTIETLPASALIVDQSSNHRL